MLNTKTTGHIPHLQQVITTVVRPENKFLFKEFLLRKFGAFFSLFLTFHEVFAVVSQDTTIYNPGEVFLGVFLFAIFAVLDSIMLLPLDIVVVREQRG